MNKINLSVFVLLLTLAMSGAVIYSWDAFHEAEPEDGQTMGAIVEKGTRPSITAKYFDEPRFYHAVNTVAIDADLNPREIKAAIVPHHLLASRMIADLFVHLSQQPDLETLIVIGPNHDGTGQGDAITTMLDWETPFGTVPGNTELTQDLLRLGILSQEPTIIENEISVSAMMPFISYYLHDVDVVPIIFKSTVPWEQINRLAAFLAKPMLGDDVAIVAAVDFAHDVSAMQGLENNHYALRLIENQDVDRLLQLGNDYLDSAPSIAFLLGAIEDQSYQVEVVRESDTALIQGYQLPRVTTYLEVFFTE